MIEKFRTESYGIGIFKVEVERETKASVWVNGSRKEKISGYHQYHATYQQAFEYLEGKYSQKLSGAKDRLNTARNEYERVKQLKNKKAN